jgi:uncharacterized protein (TIGR02444 family)
MSTDLWDFAQKLYGRPGVEKLLLRLQASGADVCLLLSALWLEQRKANCTESRCAALQAIARPWQHEVVKPLRQLRMNWREAALQDEQLAGLREQIKSLEIQAERSLLLQLEQHCAEWSEEEPGDWLGKLAGMAGRDNRDALEELRIAAANA